MRKKRKRRAEFLTPSPVEVSAEADGFSFRGIIPLPPSPSPIFAG